MWRGGVFQTRLLIDVRVPDDDDEGRQAGGGGGVLVR